MSQKRTVDEAIKRLKQEAAALGANGILLEGVSESSEQSSGMVVVPNGSNVGFFVSESGSGKSAKGRAIFVIEE